MKATHKMTAWERLKAPMPKFFKSLSWIGGFIVAFTTPFLIADASFFKIALYVNAIGVSMIAVSKFTVKDKEETKSDALKNN